MLTDSGSGMGEGASSLFEELGRDASNIEGDDTDLDDSDPTSEAAAAAKVWEPEPAEADPAKTTRRKRVTDIISMLVGIYGTKELFVNEYRVMLADKLLNKTDYDTEREIRTLELLKLRFGENNLHSCEVMIKDLADSKRINGNVMTESKRTCNAGEHMSLDVSATLVSELFWPPFQKSESNAVTLPPEVAKSLKIYESLYHSLRAPRKLHWKPSLGMVTLELKFQSGSRKTFEVSPTHAAIIQNFSGVKSWKVTDLATAVGLSVALVRRKVVYWINQGVLVERVEGGQSYFDASDGESQTRAAWSGAHEEADSVVESAEQQREAEMAVYESYVVGMLTNFKSLPLERIHNMLKMFVVDPPYDKSAQQLSTFLGRLCARDKLELRDGSYRLK